MRFFIKDFFSKCDQIRRKLQIWSHLLKKSLMENFIFCAVGQKHTLDSVKHLWWSCLAKSVNDFYPLTIFARKLHYNFSTMYSICLSDLYNKFRNMLEQTLHSQMRIQAAATSKMERFVHKVLHLGCCSSPRSASDSSVQIMRE